MAEWFPEQEANKTDAYLLGVRVRRQIETTKLQRKYRFFGTISASLLVLQIIFLLTHFHVWILPYVITAYAALTIFYFLDWVDVKDGK